MEELIYKLKEEIIDVLNLEGMKPEDIDENAPLFVEGLGLDSIDALELGMAIRKAFGVTFSKDPAVNKKVFASVASLADFIIGEKP